MNLKMLTYEFNQVFTNPDCFCLGSANYTFILFINNKFSAKLNNKINYCTYIHHKPIKFFYCVISKKTLFRVSNEKKILARNKIKKNN